MIFLILPCRERNLLNLRDSRINCQLSNLPTSSLVSSDVEYVPNWAIYKKLDSKECNTAILLNEGPKSTGDGKNIKISFLRIVSYNDFRLRKNVSKI